MMKDKLVSLLVATLSIFFRVVIRDIDWRNICLASENLSLVIVM